MPDAATNIEAFPPVPVSRERRMNHLNSMFRHTVQMDDIGKLIAGIALQYMTDPRQQEAVRSELQLIGSSLKRIDNTARQAVRDAARPVS